MVRRASILDTKTSRVCATKATKGAPPRTDGKDPNRTSRANQQREGKLKPKLELKHRLLTLWRGALLRKPS